MHNTFLQSVFHMKRKDRESSLKMLWLTSIKNDSRSSVLRKIIAVKTAGTLMYIKDR